jgi:hypothetical protein
MTATYRKLDRIDATLLSSNPRANVNAWKKYEPIVLTAYKLHPKPYIYRPANMAPSTICSRLRDAIRGKIAFDHPSELSSQDIARWYSEVVIKSDKEQVLIGPPTELAAAIRGTSVGSTKPLDMIFENLSFEELSAFTLLLSGGRLTGPVLVKTPPDISLLPQRPNVEMMKRQDGSLVLL